MTLTIEREPSPPGTYFWAQQFMPAGPVDHGGYFGLQTGGTIGNQVVGKMLIFSIWNAVEAQAGPSATAQPFGGEGIGYSVRRAFAWQENVPYTFRMQRQADPLWWALDISAPGMEPIHLGRIRVTQQVGLGHWLPQFTEYFTQLPGCHAMPPARAVFSNLMFDQYQVAAQDPTTYGPCRDWARSTIVNGASVHETGIASAEQ
ncbi:hypothetical protein EZ242_02040 [Ramlibacter rhizophilus]|uniref:DUF3472 domain-containing protein n=1 Tax=Ramlibacter rhizophilus TaxID=1781167 RepID=A0A4Z0C0V9_9BURK|nr:hypothetical protein EZ242_02040 [Ramlibacter rhizophilus]